MYGKKCMKLDNIIRCLNNENAYLDWRRTFPDDETEELADSDFNTKEDFRFLMNCFIYIYKKYHKSGLYTNNEIIIRDAHFIDDKLNLKPIEIIKRKEV